VRHENIASVDSSRWPLELEYLQGLSLAVRIDMLAAAAKERSVLEVALRTAASEAGSSAVRCSAGPWVEQYRPAVCTHAVEYRRSVGFVADFAAGIDMVVADHQSSHWDPSLMRWRSC
jgi:hypothetical protein